VRKARAPRNCQIFTFAAHVTDGRTEISLVVEFGMGVTFLPAGRGVAAVLGLCECDIALSATTA
jgi:hypothetical protein